MGIESNEKKNWRKMLLSKGTMRVVSLMPLLLRLAVISLTAASALAMGLDKQTRSVTVAIVGTTPIFQTITAKFQHTPAFVYFVIANAIVSVYNLLVLVLRFFFSKYKLYQLTVNIADVVMMALVVTGAAAATSMAELGKHGNYHARWNPICDRFEAFCHRGVLALIAAFVASVLFVTLNAYTVVILHNKAEADKRAADSSGSLLST